MIKNIFKLALRNLFHNKIYSVVILFSLSVGFAVASLLTGFIVRELNTDNFNQKKKRIYRVLSDDPFNQGHNLSYIQRQTIDFLDSHFPEIERSCIIYPLRQHGLSKVRGEGSVSGLHILNVDSSFLNIFDFPLYMGNRAHALDPGNIILSIETAKKIFGNDYMNAREVEVKTDTLTKTYNISGFTDLPTENSHLTFDGLTAFSSFNPLKGGASYILLNKGSRAQELEKKINASGKTPGMMGEGKLKFYLQPLKKVYWDEHNTRTFSLARNRLILWISGSVIIMVLFLATFNFLNLFFLLFVKRWKEFGIKKIMGASVSSLRLIATTEVLICVIFSTALAFFISYLVLPWFDTLLRSGMSPDYFIHPGVMLILGSIIILISIAAVYRISGYLYKIKPINLLGGKTAYRYKFEQWMLVLQFIISIILISCSLVIFQQLHYIHNKPLGFNRDILEVRAPSGNLKDHLPYLKQEMLSVPGIEAASVCNGNPFSDNWIIRYDLDDGSFYTPYFFSGDADHLKTLGIRLLKGTAPPPENGNERLVNQAFVKYFNFQNPIGMRIPGTQDEYISGIVNDFNISSLKMHIPPAIIGYSGESDCLLMKLNPSRISEIVPALQEQWQNVFPGYPLKYLFVNDELYKNHQDDMLFSRITGSVMIISILITCFGLFALSWSTAQDRSREIGIRKVFGATRINVIFLLANRFLKWILIAYIIAVPFAWYLSNRWLEAFAFKIRLNIWMFLAAGIIISFISLITVGYQTLKSSITNPVDELRYE